jgi:hypothetical protein
MKIKSATEGMSKRATPLGWAAEGSNSFSELRFMRDTVPVKAQPPSAGHGK